MGDSAKNERSLDAFDRLQIIARQASAYCLVAAGAVFIVGVVLLSIVLFGLGRDGFAGSGGPALSDYAQMSLMFASTVLLPTILLAVAGIVLRLYAEAQVLQEERHEGLLEAVAGGAADAENEEALANGGPGN